MVAVGGEAPDTRTGFGRYDWVFCRLADWCGLPCAVRAHASVDGPSGSKAVPGGTITTACRGSEEGVGVRAALLLICGRSALSRMALSVGKSVPGVGDLVTLPSCASANSVTLRDRPECFSGQALIRIADGSAALPVVTHRSPVSFTQVTLRAPA